MAEEIVASLAALANGENESNDKEFLDAVALINGENESNDKEFPDAVALTNGENESNDKEFPDAVALTNGENESNEFPVAVEEENTENTSEDAAAASRDRGAAVKLFIKKIQDLEQASILDFQNDRFELSDFKAKLASASSELSESELSRFDYLKPQVAQISSLDGKIRILRDDIKNLELEVKLLRILRDDMNLELETKLKIKTNEQETKSLVSASLTQLRALGTASAVGVAALGTLYLVKRK